MKKGVVIAILVILILFVLATIAYAIYKINSISNLESKDNKQKENTVYEENNSSNLNTGIEESACASLGCPKNTMYVGSKNSDKFYECSCRYAKRVKPENIVCFSSESDARAKGYSLSEC